MKSTGRVLCLASIVAVSLLFVCATSFSRDMGGWEKEGAYNKLYKASELDKLKCWVKKVKEVVPMKGMSPGIALIADDGDGEEFVVHIGPKWYLGKTRTPTMFSVFVFLPIMFVSTSHPPSAP